MRASRDLYGRLSQCAIKLERSTPAYTKSRFMKLLPAFESFAETIEILTPEKVNYDKLMAFFLIDHRYTVEHGVVVWDRSFPKTKEKMTDRLRRINSLRSKICDDAKVITAITDY